MTIATTTAPTSAPASALSATKTPAAPVNASSLVPTANAMPRHDKGRSARTSTRRGACAISVLRERLREVQVEGDHGACLMGDGDARGVR
jgi:hypothetical protein